MMASAVFGKRSSSTVDEGSSGELGIVALGVMGREGVLGAGVGGRTWLIVLYLA